MANELVKYQNDLNTVTMRNWTEAELNIFFSIVAKIRDKSTTEVVFTFDQLKELSKFKKNVTKKEFTDYIFQISAKLGTLNYIERIGLKGKVIILFQEFAIDGDNEKLTVEVNSKFEYIFNKIGIEFTEFELEEFVGISSTYTKTLYRLLKQYRSTGWWQVTLEDFRELLSIPDSYKSGNIDQQILNPSIEQLGGSDENAIFKNLEVIKIKKKGRGRGGVLTGYKFKFVPVKTGNWVEGKFSKEKNKPNYYNKKVEKLPEWGKDDYVAPEEKPVAPKTKEHFNDRLKKFREKDIQSK